MSVLEIKGLTVQVTTEDGPKDILRGVDLTVKAGEIHALMGENGAGKSTLIRILAGLEMPDAGQISFHGAPVALTSPAAAEGLGLRFLLQELQSGI